MLKLFLSVFLAICLGGCSVPFPSNQEDAYMKSKNACKLVVPAPLQDDEISSFYVLPEATGQKKVKIEP